MKRLRFTHTCRLDFDEMVTNHFWNLRIIPHDDPSQTITLESVRIWPDVPEVKQKDGFGNVLLIGECKGPHDSFGYEVSGTAIVRDNACHGRHLNQIYRYYSRLTKPGKTLLAYHDEFVADMGRLSGLEEPEAIHRRVFELNSRIFREMAYVPGATTVATTAEEAFRQRKGVCQDYAHIMLALLRHDGIPARYVGGVMIGEGATHAWVEYYDGTSWWGIDPTNDCIAGDTYVVLVRGRDHYDCPMERGVLMSSSMQRMKTHVKVVDLGLPEEQMQVQQ